MKLLSTMLRPGLLLGVSFLLKGSFAAPLDPVPRQVDSTVRAADSATVPVASSSTGVVWMPVTTTLVWTPATTSTLVWSPATTTPLVWGPVTTTAPVVWTPVMTTSLVWTPVTTSPMVWTPVTTTTLVWTPVPTESRVLTPVTTTYWTSAGGTSGWTSTITYPPTPWPPMSPWPPVSSTTKAAATSSQSTTTTQGLRTVTDPTPPPPTTTTTQGPPTVVTDPVPSCTTRPPFVGPFVFANGDFECPYPPWRARVTNGTTYTFIRGAPALAQHGAGFFQVDQQTDPDGVGLPPATLSQFFNVTPGTTYTLTFWVWFSRGAGAVTATLSGQPIAGIDPGSPGAAELAVWQQVATRFTANLQGYTLEFAFDVGAKGAVVRLDNVVLTPGS